MQQIKYDNRYPKSNHENLADVQNKLESLFQEISQYSLTYPENPKPALTKFLIDMALKSECLEVKSSHDNIVLSLSTFLTTKNGERLNIHITPSYNDNVLDFSADIFGFKIFINPEYKSERYNDLYPYGILAELQILPKDYVAKMRSFFRETIGSDFSNNSTLNSPLLPFLHSPLDQPDVCLNSSYNQHSCEVLGLDFGHGEKLTLYILDLFK